MASTSRHFLHEKRIVVSGAGVSGLAFAISLHKQWPSISSEPVPSLTLYERDPCAVPPSREGYSLSLRSDSPSAGIQTLQKMGILDQILAASIASFGGEKVPKDEQGGFVIWNQAFNPFMKVRNKTPKGIPVAATRIARASLRQTLVSAVEALPGVSIKWGIGITGVTTSPDGAIEIHTSKHQTETYDLLIAADGSSSKLRTLLRPLDGLVPAGPTCIYGITPLAHSPSGKANEFGPILSGTGPALFIAPVDHNKMVWCLSWHPPTPHLPHHQPLTQEETTALLAEAKTIGEAAYGPNFLPLLRDTDPKTLNKFNAMDKLPFLHTGSYIHVPTEPSLDALNGNVIFLGDANHAVSPFAGNGANLALMDGWDLAASLVSSASLAEAVTKYDGLAVGRARRVVRMSRFTIKVMHSTGWTLRVWKGVLRVLRLLLLFL